MQYTDDMKKAIAVVLKFADGMAVESEGCVYVRSLEGENYAAGVEGHANTEEIEFGADLNSAIEYFLKKREEENHD